MILTLGLDTAKVNPEGRAMALVSYSVHYILIYKISDDFRAKLLEMKLE